MAAGVAALAGLLLAAPAPASAQPALTADAAIAHQRDQLVQKARIGCRRSSDDAEEILVCGREGADPNRIEVEAAPGGRTRLLPGEPAGSVAAMAAGDDPCTTVGPNQRCSGGIDMFRVGSVLFKIGKHLLNKDD
jgi:hypothetical protein